MTQNCPNWPKIAKMAQKWPKMAQKLAPAKKNSRDISPVSPLFCISALRENVKKWTILCNPKLYNYKSLSSPLSCSMILLISEQSVFVNN